MYACFASMQRCSQCGCSAYGGHKRASYPLELKLQVAAKINQGENMHPQRGHHIPAVAQT